MAVVYYFGDVPVSKEELSEKSGSLLIPNLKELGVKSSSKLEFREGSVNYDALTSNKNVNMHEFTQIGINKPMSVEILSVYTGDAPQKFLGGKKDMLLVSGVKSFSTFEAAPKAINMIKKKIQDKQLLSFSALEDGCPIVYYTKAVDSSTIYLSYNLIADTFNEQTFNTVSKLFTGAAGLPIFAPAAPYLLAGSVITNIIGNIGKTIFSSPPFLMENEDLRFDTPGMLISLAKQLIICNDNQKDEFNDYAPGIKDEKVVMINKKDGKAYQGDAPYIILNRDGRERIGLSEFTPKLASAALLEKFYGSPDKLDQSFDVLQTAMTLYNDLAYSKKITNLEKSLSKMKKESEEYKNMTEILDAYKKNIVMDEFKKKEN